MDVSLVGVKLRALTPVVVLLLVAAPALASTWSTADLRPYQQPEQIVTTTSALLRVARGLTCAPIGTCSWTATLAGLPTAEARASSAGLGWVGYDLERWKASYPDNQHPLAALKAFGQRAHADGLHVLMAPGLRFGSWFQLRRAKAIVRYAARYGDVLLLQVEAWDCAPYTFESYTRLFANIARSVHPGIRVLVNQVERRHDGWNGSCYIGPAWRLASGFVSGRWVWLVPA